jgi:ABC-type glycerol-3-phosphate transport system permease component
MSTEREAIVSETQPGRRVYRAAARPAAGALLSARAWRIGEGLLIHLLAYAGALVMLFPLYWMVRAGLKPESEVFAWPPSLLPGRLDFGVWVRAWNSGPFARFMVTSLFVSSTAMAASLFVNSLGAFAFAKYRFRGQNLLFVLYLSTMMIPGQVTMIPLFLTVRDLGWVNTYQGIIAPGLASGFAVFLIRQYMVTIPSELMDAARIDGANEWGIYWRIVLPLSQPVLIVWALLSFLHSWNDFLWPLIILNERFKFTLPIGLQYFQTEYYTIYNQMLAITTISLIPVLLLFLLFQKYIVQGIATTGLRG